jgi:hypothetical protein
MFTARASVALDTVLEIRYAFSNMLGTNSVRLMLVTTEASELAGIVVDVAGRAGGGVRAL